MEFYPFPAQLRAGYNNVDVPGQASVMEREDAVEFTGDFIPLLPLGETAAVDWAYGERALVTFEGQVYLSSPRLLRLVGVDKRLAEAARATFAMNTRMPCLLTVRQKGQGPVQYPAEILYLSGDSFTLHVKYEILPEQTVYLSAEVDFLTLRDLPLYVRRVIALRRGDDLLLCEPQSRFSDENRIALSAYSARLEQLA